MARFLKSNELQGEGDEERRGEESREAERRGEDRRGGKTWRCRLAVRRVCMGGERRGGWRMEGRRKKKNEERETSLYTVLLQDRRFSFKERTNATNSPWPLQLPPLPSLNEIVPTLGGEWEDEEGTKNEGRQNVVRYSASTRAALLFQGQEILTHSPWSLQLLPLPSLNEIVPASGGEG